VKPPSLFSSFTSGKHSSTLHLNAFRGVRAISEFDWPFTPIHKSSESFSTLTGSALHSEIIGPSACPWIDHSVSRLSPLTIALLRLAFAMLPHLKCLGRQWGTTRRLIMQKARRHPYPKVQTPTACKRTVSGSLSLPFSGCFSPFPYGTGSLSVSR
jgi:hypothetical protein